MLNCFVKLENKNSLMLMITTSTPISNSHYLNQHAENISSEYFNDLDLMFYESIKSQMDLLNKNPDEETISKILAYSKSL
ncbi:hypothetical protein TH53_12065 [Pedobacter lusitanus]|uniref:Uncharacterized protein n=2 Tax=Pedobacter lusitanus TaxID=1503925 RepID=A0A0D0FWS9_9SPHI|nr:hypothetical protein TH53_12065 [Pedobacter lusitanus]